LRKNTSFRKKFHYNLSGVTIKAKGSRLNVFEITQVRGRSVADRAGILPGDIIVTINGIPAGALELGMINGYFNSKPGKRVNLIIDRQGQKMKKDFKLKDQI
jgi:C-terminal processing protease CtpA/Prc